MAISTAIQSTQRAAALGIATAYRNLKLGGVNYLPQSIAVIGQGNTASTYDTTKSRVFTPFEVGSTYGFGSPLHLAVTQLLPTNGDGVGTIPVNVYPLEDDGSGVAAAGDITPVVGIIAETLSYQVSINNVLSEPFLVEVGDAVADVIDKMVTAVNAVTEMPVIASDGTTVLDLTAKWAGSSGNSLNIAMEGPNEAAQIDWTISQPTGGLNNPDVQDALDQIGTAWETLIVNCMDPADTTALNAYSNFNEGRWGSLVRKPCVVFTGNNESDVSTAITITDARKTDRTNCQLVEPGGVDLPWVIAARQVARIAKIAQDNPATAYNAQRATGLTPGTDGVQWTNTQKDAAVKGGSSTIDVVDGEVRMADTVTMYHPTGDPEPAYRWVVDIIKLQNIIYNIDLIFSAEAWAAAPLIPDEQATVNPRAKKPKMAKAEIAALINSLGLEAIISDPEAAKASISAGINTTNPKRLDVALTVAVSGNTFIKSVDLFFGFYYGTEAVIG